MEYGPIRHSYGKLALGASESESQGRHIGVERTPETDSQKKQTPDLRINPLE